MIVAGANVLVWVGLGRRRVRVPRLRDRGRSRFTNPFYSALALIGNLASLAVLYLLLSAEFVAAAQVLVYAGAVMVMFLFVIAYLGGRADAPWAGGPSWQTVGAVARLGALLVEVDRRRRPEGERPALARGDDRRAPSAARPRSGALFLTDHLLAFEITSIVLLVAAVGGVDPRHALARRADAEESQRVLGPGRRLVPRASPRSCSRRARSACCCAAAR